SVKFVRQDGSQPYCPWLTVIVLFSAFIFCSAASAQDTNSASGPKLLSAATMAPSPQLGLSFNKALLPASVTNLGHYSLSPTNVVITGAELMPDQTTVALFVAGPVWDDSSITVSGLEAADGTTMGEPMSVGPLSARPVEWFDADVGAVSEPSLSVTS